MTHKRIMIFGLPGSGKSTFAHHLATQLNYPLYHLDKYYFVENWVEREKESFLKLQQSLVEQDRWIIDGNGLRSLDMRYKRAELVLYFCPPRPLCFLRLLRRRITGSSFADRAPECRERLPLNLIKYMWTFNRRVTPLLSQLQRDYPHVPFYEIRSTRNLDEVFHRILS